MTPWSFLLGDWVGRGSLRGGDLDARTAVTAVFGDVVQSEMVCSVSGEIVHQERILWFVHADTGPSAVSVSAGGRSTHWTVREHAPGHLEMTPGNCEPPERRSLSWTLILRPDSTLHETYREGDPEDVPMVELQHVRKRTK